MVEPAGRRRGIPIRGVHVLVAIAAVAVLWALSNVVLVLFFAVLLGCVLHGVAAETSRRTGIREGYTLAVVTVMLAVAAVGVTYWIAPKLAREGQQLAGHLSDIWGGLEDRLGLSHGSGGGGVGLHVLRGPLASPLESVLSSSLDMLAGAVVIIVTAVYLAADPGLYVRGVLHLVPFGRRARVHAIMLRVGRTLQLWVLGQLVDMLAVGVLAGAGLAILGVQDPVALGVLSGLLTFVPYFGAILAAIPATLVALTVGWTTALWALGVYTLCHCVEGYVIAPIVQRRMVDLPPALTVVSMTIAGSLFGLLGIALGTPLAAAALIIVRMGYVEDVLGDGTVGAEAGEREVRRDDAVA